MPKKNYQVRELTLPRESRKLYKEVFENAKLEIEQLGQNVSAHIILTKFIKASQVASGYLKTDEGNFIRLKSNPKLKELKSLIEEILYEDAITIWCKYRFSIAIIEEMLQEMGVRYEVITGDVQNKSAVAKKFQTTSIKELPVMLCQIRAGGIGLNLHKASFSIFYENEWRLQDRLQAEDRLHR
ncbi:MAG: hypothetical protein GWN64_06870, partial [Candidatus Thorarchaeota archaeon]|nr:hypothetical protein [Candidatus Thorarchaeota archaeon]